MFISLAGEGAQVGRVTVFVRFAGCNLWSGREEDRSDAQCPFCDTSFRGTDGPLGGTYDAEALVGAAKKLWGERGGQFYVVFTGGEPSLQLDEPLVRAFAEAGFETGIETNGTRALPEGLDWVCVSPKGQTERVVHAGQELKLVYPQAELDPASFLDLKFKHFYLQPLYSDDHRYWSEAAKYCLEHPQWKLSLQNHKELGLP